MKSILILSVDLAGKGGGIASYYSLVQKYFSSSRMRLCFYNTEKIRNHNIGSKIWKTLFNFKKLLQIFKRHDLVVFNTSLDSKAVLRDGLFHFFAKHIFRRKTVIFFRGWNPEFEHYITKYWKRLFRFIFDADQIIVLGRYFQKKLIEWDFDPYLIRIETTTYEGCKESGSKDPHELIFLSRFVLKKGCLEAIKSVEYLVDEFPQLKLYMVGDGPLFSQLKEYVVRRRLENNITFTGWLFDKEKTALLKKCGIMLFPTEYGEGMPNCILQGMGMGCAIISRPVAGIPDIVQNGVNGFLVDSMDPIEFADKIRNLLLNANVWKEMSNLNKEKALRTFEINQVVKRLEKLFYEAINESCK